MQNDNVKIAVIGGGAAGMMAAGTALMYGADVTVFEHTGRLGKKLAITGKGRCNVTNDCTVNEFIENVITNSRFMYAPLAAFSPSDTVSFFENLGVPLKTERGRRVFPVSDKAADIVKALKKYSAGATIKYENAIEIIAESGHVTGVRTSSSCYKFDSVILATGGKSYPLTGSDGSGYNIAKKLGHRITPLTPSLVPIECRGDICRRMQGLSLKNTGLKIKDKSDSVIFEDFGEMLFTHFGISGPMILSASSHLHGYDISSLTAELDLKPALDEHTLETRILSDFSKSNNKDFINSLSALLPLKMIEPVIELSGIDPRKKVNSITKEERKSLLYILKHFPIELDRFRPIDEAIITSGGIDVSEISPKTMMSKLVDGLYFAGEIIDVDAYTGGYNLQIAFSTAYLAAENAAVHQAKII